MFCGMRVCLLHEKYCAVWDYVAFAGTPVGHSQRNNMFVVDTNRLRERIAGLMQLEGASVSTILSRSVQ